MATMDTIKLYGAEPANFLDVGGGATTDKVTEAFKLMLRNPAVKGILVNIFGGIMRCDTIAEGVIAAAKEVNLGVPLVVRMRGTNEELGRQKLRESGLQEAVLHAAANKPLMGVCVGMQMLLTRSDSNDWPKRSRTAVPGSVAATMRCTLILLLSVTDISAAAAT